MERTELCFPDWFLWGTATASHQVEGNNTNNDWWAWEQAGGHIRDGDRSGLACDWWNRAEEDFDLARQLGQNSHRLSLEWSRLEPRPGEWNSAAIARYRQILEGLHERGLEPMVTLWHFTLPLWFSQMGGWTNPNALKYFSRYVERVVEDLGDLVNLWCTINEPAVYAFESYLAGKWPPGQQSLNQARKVLRTLLLAHGEAYRIIHALRGDARVGLVKNLMVVEPARPDARSDNRLSSLVDRVFNVLPLDAVMDGRFKPPLGFGTVPKLIGTMDFIGVNYYSRYLFGLDRENPAGSFTPRLRQGAEVSNFDYGEIYPQGLYQVLKRVQHYGKPIYITENGLPDRDDALRPRFLLTHLAQVWRAMQEGVQVRGYYHWSLVDNFEWAEGYAMRFGLIEIDFATQERRIRESGRLYGQISQASAITPELANQYAPEAMDSIFGN